MPRDQNPPIPTSLDWDEAIGLLPNGTLNVVSEDDPVPNVDNEDDIAEDALVEDALPRSLYVCRMLKNGDELRAWAKSQGFVSVLNDLHVTVLYSKAAVDWFRLGDDWTRGDDAELIVKEGGPRAVERFGDGAIVLQFSNTSLQWRHESMIERGASHSHDEYQPHVTITYKPPDGLDLDAIVPYRGRLVFGAEIFEEIKLKPDGGAERIEIVTRNELSL